MKRSPYTNFDTPRKLILAGNDYIPPKARTSEERERRHELPGGNLKLQQQERGIRVFSMVLNNIHDDNDVSFVSRVISSCGLISGWNQFARYAPVMRRQNSIPNLGWPLELERPSSDERLVLARNQLERVGESAGKLVTLHAERRRGIMQQSTKVGRAMVDAGLEVACIGLADDLQKTVPFETQVRVRNRCLEVFDDAHQLGAKLGTQPSFAQAADPDSDLSVHIRRTAPIDVFYAFEAAQAVHAIPR